MMDDAASRTAITDLLHRYAYHVRMRQGELCADLFTENGSYELWEVDASDRSATPNRRWRLEGRDEIRDYIGKSTQGAVSLCPLIHNVMTSLQGTIAQSNCVMISHSWPTGRGTIGEYDDSYSLFDGRWSFSARKYTIFLAQKDSQG